MSIKPVGCLLASCSGQISCISKQISQTPTRKGLQGSSSKPSHHKDSKAPDEPVTFLFSVNELDINDNPSRGGVAPRTDEHGYWVPPTFAAGFKRSAPKHLYRWKNGVIDKMEADASTVCDFLDPYKTSTVVYCDPWLQFRAVPYDASSYDVESTGYPRWHCLSFTHYEGISRVGIAGTAQYLAGGGQDWINQLGLSTYCNDNDNSQSQGLTGDLGILIALIAFSCRANDLDKILMSDKAWHRYRWSGHNRRHGSMQQKLSLNFKS